MFEFDHYKSELNRIKHGIDFNQAKQLWDDPNRIVILAKTVDEKRYLLKPNSIKVFGRLYSPSGKI